jgi:hypothetical protein
MVEYLISCAVKLPVIVAKNGHGQAVESTSKKHLQMFQKSRFVLANLGQGMLK